tara:strand:- start:27665 stop:27892 length:228 start_codon:yes stop_codon:yes gene_type:complete
VRKLNDIEKENAKLRRAILWADRKLKYLDLYQDFYNKVSQFLEFDTSYVELKRTLHRANRDLKSKIEKTNPPKGE